MLNNTIMHKEPFPPPVYVPLGNLLANFGSKLSDVLTCISYMQESVFAMDVCN